MSRKSNAVKLIVYGVFFLIFIGIISVDIAGQFVSNDYTVKVTDKIVKHSKENSKYLIFTELKNGEIRVFQDTDSLVRGKFNSSDVYGEIKVGHEYKFNTYGLRIPFFSKYENIVNVQKIK